ncbi:alpha-L-arabinofuranosidase C-terminal domain-containing protein [Nonomuraea guangzhouensis]|nr:alpha-L-arabinofuranosidase C-terminal domain-containing protein [Nonomuraea guangzhouensis]
MRLPAAAVLIALAGVAGLPSSPAQAHSERTGTAATRITVSQERYVTTDGRPVGEVPAAIVGANQRWPDDGKGIWNSAAGRAADGIVRLSEQAGLDMLRYPGGTVANLFDFRRAIGPQDQRKCQTSGGFANGRFASTDSRFGPDENEKYVRSIGGETMMMVSAINQSAADAADFVEYMNAPADGKGTNPNGGVNWGDVRARNGHPKPYGIRYWEFGNEPYLVGQHYWWSGEATARLQQFIEGGWQRQTAKDASYQDNDGLFRGCDLATRRQGTGEPNQEYRVRFAPIALPGDDEGAAGVGDGPIAEPVLRVAGSPWQRVASLAGQASDAHVYTVGKADGIVRFGDGTHGAVPPAGASLSIEYTSGIHQGYVAFRKAMKAVDPSIEVCSGWGRPEFVEAMGSRPYDCLGTHSYSTPLADGTLTRYGNLQVAAARRDADLSDLRDRMARHFPDAATRPDLLVTEYGTLNTPAPAYEARLAHVLYLAAQVAGQLENDVRVSINSNTADLPQDDGSPDPANLFGSPPDFLMTGRAHMLGLYATMAGGHVVKSAVTGNPALTAPAGTYAALRVVSTCNGGVIRTMVVNRDAEHTVPADVALPGKGVTGTVSVSTVNGASVESYNAPDHPRDISVRVSREKADQGVLSHEFEPHSVTLLRFTGQGRACGS